MAEVNMKNLNAILKWSASLEGGERQQDKKDGNLSALDEEKKAYLHKVMASMTIDNVDKMKRIFNVMLLDQTTLPEDEDFDIMAAKLAALEELQDIIEDIDNATDFMKIGGVGVCYAALNDDNTEAIKLQAIACLASAAQNHPAVQVHLFDTGVVDKLLSILQDITSSSPLLETAVRGISCVIRGQHTITEDFIRKKGVQVLASTLKRETSPTRALFIKVAYLTGSLALDFLRFQTIVRVAGLLDALVDTLASSTNGDNDDDNDVVWEHTLRAFVNCSTNETSNVTFLFEKTKFAELLENRERYLTTRPVEDREKLLEEFEYTATLKLKGVNAAS
eukprot:m.89975 g.89975  ORF g.89975 m.89975 type:complete len:335 (-) comp26351_c0_seq1:349-1353(-)